MNSKGSTDAKEERKQIMPRLKIVEIEETAGRVKRIFESFGYEVSKLDRVMFAGLTKKNLPRSKWRFLKDREIVKLKYLK